MLLRSLTKHVKDQNWFAVFLDFFIVVVGILIAFQINNWNEARGEQRAEVKFLLSLEEDMEGSIMEVDSVISQLETHDAARQILFEFSVGKKQNVTPNKFPELAHRALWSFASVELKVTTFETLQSSGRLGVIGDDGIVTSLQDLAALMDEAEFEEQLEVHALEKFTDPILFDYVDMAEVLKTPTLDLKEVVVPWLGTEPSSSPIPEFVKTMQFRNGLLIRSASTNERIITLKRIQKKCIEISKLIDARQKKLETK